MLLFSIAASWNYPYTDKRFYLYFCIWKWKEKRERKKCRTFFQFEEFFGIGFFSFVVCYDWLKSKDDDVIVEDDFFERNGKYIINILFFSQKFLVQKSPAWQIDFVFFPQLFFLPFSTLFMLFPWGWDREKIPAKLFLRAFLCNKSESSWSNEEMFCPQG